MRALSLLRDGPVYRRDRFAAGLSAAGFRLCQAISDPSPDDALLIWNRYSDFDREAKRFEKAGASVFVAENQYLSGIVPGKWHAMSLGHHNGAGTWREGPASRWGTLGVELKPWRTGNEVVILAQRGIGEDGVASPPGWAEETQRKIGGRIRAHPGKEAPAVPLDADLGDAACVVTWASSAALAAMIMGVRAWYAMPKWIGGDAGRHLDYWGETQHGDFRLSMFRRLIWAQWRVEEIEDGSAFRRLLGN